MRRRYALDFAFQRKEKLQIIRVWMKLFLRSAIQCRRFSRSLKRHRGFLHYVPASRDSGRNDNLFSDLLTCRLADSLDVQVLHVQRILFNELATRFHIFAHQDGKYLVGFDDVFQPH